MRAVKRMFYNDDGHTTIVDAHTGPCRREIVTDSVDVLAGTPVTTLAFCVASGGLTNYPSKVGSMTGWRQVASSRRGKYRWQYEFYRHVRQQGWDIPQIVRDRSAELGIEFIPSVRMNDAHFGQKVHPLEHPLTPEFWLEHRDLVTGPADFPFWGNEHLLDFKHREVRDWMLALMREVIDRYGGQGFEMDWTRHYTFFRPGEEQPDLLTDLVRAARQRLDQHSPTQRLPLIVRVAPTIEQSLMCGLDVSAWIKEDLVDYVVPGDPCRYISLDLPLAEWVELARGSRVEIHPGVDNASHYGQATLEMYRAAASNYYHMGTDGFYLFNLFCQGFPLADRDYVTMRDVSCPAALDRRDKLFMALPAPNQWRKDTATLPVELCAGGSPAAIGLYIGDDLDKAYRDTTLKQATLRLWLDHLDPDEWPDVHLNGTPVSSGNTRCIGHTRRDVIAYDRSHESWPWIHQVMGSNPGTWCEIDLSSPRSQGLMQGDNRVLIALRSRRGAIDGITSKLVGVQLAVSYHYAGRA